MTRRAFLLLMSAALARPAGAQSGPAGQFVSQIGRDFSAALAGTHTAAERRERLVPFLSRVVDIDGTSRFCLGRYWRLATPEQQREYQAIFVRALAAAVAIRADAYSAERTEVTVLPEVAVPEGTSVRTVVRNPGQAPVTITWLVETSQLPYRIIDVQAEGISLRQTLRSDYAAYLRQNGADIDAFLRSLRAHTS